MTKILSGVSVALLITCGVLYFQNSNLTHQVDVANTTIETQKTNIVTLHSQLSTANEKAQLATSYQEQVKSLQQVTEQQKRKIDTYKSRQQTVIAKPELVQKLERKSWKKFFEVKNEH